MGRLQLNQYFINVVASGFLFACSLNIYLCVYVTHTRYYRMENVIMLNVSLLRDINKIKINYTRTRTSLANR